MTPWEMGKQLVWDVTVVDALAPSRLNQGSLCNPGTTATEAEARKIEKYRELIDNGYIFQPVTLEVQGSLGESSEIFITRLCKMLCRSPVDCIVAGLSSLLVVFFCYWSTGIVAGMGFPTFVADHGCVSSPPNMTIHMALD